MMQIEGADDDSLMRMRSNEIGMDSLIAVDLRSWFLKQLSVSIPVLKNPQWSINWGAGRGGGRQGIP